MEDLKEQLRGFEEQVAVIKDSALRRIAFERLLETILPASRQLSPSRRHAKLPRVGRVQTQTKAKSKNKVKEYYSEAQIREAVKKLALGGFVKTLPPFKTVKKDWERYLWILTAAKKHKIEGLNNHEIAYLMTKRLYRPTKYSTANNIHKKVSTGQICLDPETERWVITPSGEAHLKNLTTNWHE